MTPRCSFPRAGLLALLVIASACAGASPPPEAHGAAHPDTLGFPAPDRPVSTIVAPRWTGEDERDRLGEAARVIALAKVRPGMTVADIGAGDGYYVARLSPIVGAAGRVIGEDIVPDYIGLLQQRVARDGLRNVTVVQGTPDDPALPARTVNVAFLIHMYHEITRPFELLWHLSGSMTPGGTVVVLDQDAPTDRHGTPPRLLACELGALGFVSSGRTTLADGAYVMLFTAPARPIPPAQLRVQLARTPCPAPR